MTRFTIASFNVKNLIGADKEYYKFQSYTPEESAWKQDWMAEQLLTMDADIVGFQEIFEQDALRDVIAHADSLGHASNDAAIPDPSQRYHRKAIFRKLAYTPYGTTGLAFAPNCADTGEAGQRRSARQKSSKTCPNLSTSRFRPCAAQTIRMTRATTACAASPARSLRRAFRLMARQSPFSTVT